jgi:hypothetical protein
MQKHPVASRLLVPGSQSVPAFERRNPERDQKEMQLWKWIGKTDAMKSKFVLSGPFLLFDSKVSEP